MGAPDCVKMYFSYWTWVMFHAIAMWSFDQTIFNQKNSMQNLATKKTKKKNSESRSPKTARKKPQIQLRSDLFTLVL